MSQTIVSRLEQLSELLPQFGCQRLLLVADEVALEQSGAARRLQPILENYDVRWFVDFEPNPRLNEALQGVQLLAGDTERVVVALGGGTAIDLAKLISFFAAQNVEPLESHFATWLASDHATPNARSNPLIAIPTTAGTGSEATQFAVLYIDQAKHSVSHPSLLPDTVILDVSLTESLPRRITAATGLDALSQAVESLWSVRSTDESRALADEALRLAVANLEIAVDAPTPASRAAMLRAAHLAGQAINISKTTAPHGLSYALTIRHGVPHGMAVALFMAPIMSFNGRVDETSVTDPRGIEHVRGVLARIASAFGVDAEQDRCLDETADRWKAMLTRLDCPTRLAAAGATSAVDREQLASSVNRERLANNPRRLDVAALRKIVEAIA